MTLTLDILYGKNDGLVLSPTELVANYLFGIPMCSPDGQKIAGSTIRTQIKVAQTKVENVFSIKLRKQVIEESRDFIREEFNNWGFIRTMYPVVCIASLKGFINSVMQTNYPSEWLSIKKIASVAVYRNVSLIPNSGSGNGATMTQNSYIFNGIAPNLGWFGQSYIPNYWRLKYVTGWDEIPADLLDFVSKLASLNVLAVLGDILYGVGMSSISISLDGVSQNTPLTRSAQGGLFGGRIRQYLDEIKDQFPALKNQYRGIAFDVL
nr:MAG TPA: head to tail adaptor [Herelleviridae sp.]